MQCGLGGGAQAGIGPGLQLPQYISAAFERLLSKESATPYQTEAYEQPCSHKLRGAITTHSLSAAQPTVYLFRITSRRTAYSARPFLHVASPSSTQMGQQLPGRVSKWLPGAQAMSGQGGQFELQVAQQKPG